MLTTHNISESLVNTDQQDLLRADSQHLLHPWADLSTLGAENALMIKHAKGVHVFDAKGKKYLDAIGGMWCVTLGYGHEELAQAMADQAMKMAYYTPFGDVASDPAAKLAQMLAELTPGDLNRAHFSTCGSTAVDSAVRIAHYYYAALGRSSKRHVLSRRNAYHGSTYLSASLSGKLADRTLFHYESEFVHHLSSPEYDPDIAKDSAESRLQTLLDEMEAEIARIGAENIACFIAEPILASGGVLVPPAGYQKATREICRNHDILYISDEVVTGFGRLGHFFASETRFDIVPDMIISAKGITSGYQPLGVVMISEKICAAMKEGAPKNKTVFSNGYTYSGHPIVCATAIKNIEIMKRDKLCEHVRDVGPYFIEKLRALTSVPIVYTVRGDHLMACVECWTGEEAGPTAKNMALAQRVDKYCEASGLLVRPYENLCIMSPPLIVERSHVDRIVAILAEALDRAQADLKAGKLD